METKNFDIVIAGSGMAGLSLAYRGIKEEVWKNKTILIVDKDAKQKNDRTWCFWQKKGSDLHFRDVYHHSWKEMSFFSSSGKQIKLETGGYKYNMIRSIDFYRYALSFLYQCAQVTFVNANILSIEDDGQVKTRESTYRATYVFNSIFIKPELKPFNQYFLQHFKGVTIKTNQFTGNPSEMFLMDYRTSQENGTTFFYVLPTSNQELFVEYTVFSKNLLDQNVYDDKIAAYLKTVLRIEEYQIVESEFGIIPMTDVKLARRRGNVINIGTAGGDTRASSGYTFTNTQKTISKILSSFKEKGHPFDVVENINSKHKLLDATILKVLDDKRYEGHQIFNDLFTNAKGETVFAFLDAESNFPQDLKIMSSLKAMYFIGPFIRSVLNMK